MYLTLCPVQFQQLLPREHTNKQYTNRCRVTKEKHYELCAKTELRATTHQLNDEDEVVELLPHQHGMEVVQQDSQMVRAVSVGHDNGHPVTGSTVGGVVVTPGLQAWVQPHDLRQVGGVLVNSQAAN